MTHAARVNDREHQLLGIGETAAAEVFETCAHASLALALQPFPAESQSCSTNAVCTRHASRIDKVYPTLTTAASDDCPLRGTLYYSAAAFGAQCGTLAGEAAS